MLLVVGVNWRNEGRKASETGAWGQSSAVGSADFAHVDHTVVVQDMIDCLGAERDVAIPVRSVRPAVELMLAMYQSAHRQRTIALPITDDETVWSPL